MKIRPIFKTIDIFSFIQFLSRQTNYIIKFFLLKVLYLVREQINQLKGIYLDQHLQETCDECASYGEIANAEKIVDDWLIYDAYADTLFSPDDFW